MQFSKSEAVGAALYRITSQAFISFQIDGETERWVAAYPAKAAKIYRYHAATVFRWADLHIQSNNYNHPEPQEFMPYFRELAYTKVLGFFDEEDRGWIGRLMWPMMMDDVDTYSRLVATLSEDRSPELILRLGEEWLKDSGFDITRDPSLPGKSGLIVLTSAATIPQEVKQALSEHCR